jgi:hypothetical protein
MRIALLPVADMASTYSDFCTRDMRAAPTPGSSATGWISRLLRVSLRDQGRPCGRQRHDGNRGTGLTPTPGGNVARTSSAGLQGR